MTQKQSLPQRSASDIDDDDADMYAALWAAAPFPRLPDDAPVEFKELMITIDDPRRVYTIHKAARRHQFNILVERYSYSGGPSHAEAYNSQIYQPGSLWLSIAEMSYQNMFLESRTHSSRGSCEKI